MVRPQEPVSAAPDPAKPERRQPRHEDCIPQSGSLNRMEQRHLFLIDSDSSGHRLTIDGQIRGKFQTLESAEAAADNAAKSLASSATLRFELEFKSTLTDLEIRAATLESPEDSQSVESLIAPWGWTK